MSEYALFQQRLGGNSYHVRAWRQVCGAAGLCLPERVVEIQGCPFLAADGLHQAHSYPRQKVKRHGVELEMRDAPVPGHTGDGFFIDTGSPHHVIFRQGCLKYRFA